MTFSEIYYLIIDRFQNTYTGSILAQFVTLIKLVGPYFILAIFINVVLRYYLFKREFIFTVRKEKYSIFLVGLVGILSPLPTYIAVPMGLSLVSGGLPLSAAIAFIVASPLLNPGIFYLTLTQLGLPMAMARLVSTFILAVGAGFLSRLIKIPFKKVSGYNPKEVVDKPHPFGIELYRSVLFLGRYFLIAVFIGACIKALVPEEIISRIFNGNGSASLIVAIGLGVPFYSCGGAAIPLIQILGEMGMNPGAALAFFISGPSTKLETLYTYRSILGPKGLVYFLCFTMLGSFTCGAIFLKIMVLLMR